MTLSLPPLPRPAILADLCRETAATLRVPPPSLEKDLYLTRLLWLFADQLGPGLLLKGGTCLMKVDVGFRRMSEDVDLVVPWKGSVSHKGTNARHTNRVRDLLQQHGRLVGIRLQSPDGQSWDKRSHVSWTVHYDSEFGRPNHGGAPTATIDIEVAMRPALLSPRRAALRTAMSDPVLGDYSSAYCFALDVAEVRAEKVRAAFTREQPQIRDYYDLGLLLDCGADFTSDDFVALVDRKLAELGAPPLAEQPARFGLIGHRLRDLERGLGKGLEAVVRIDEPQFDLEPVLQAFDTMWAPRRSQLTD